MTPATSRGISSNRCVWVTHCYDYFGRGEAIAEGRSLVANAHKHAAAFYQKLATLLRDPDLVSIAYCGDGDYETFRVMAQEQRRRANLTGHLAGYALQLNALSDFKIINEAWGSEIIFFDEGLGYGDLRIQGDGRHGAHVEDILLRPGKVPGRYILSPSDLGEMAGFDRENDDGWVLYRRQAPDDRRVALERALHMDDRSIAELDFGRRGK